ncbi:MAG: family 10 glycosylhydrolase [Bacilli bacterium]|nr:family 10 glycosylhydrolase [Bacilli bacterium]MBR6137732.1 family 10 glycosylhydrolase [Bacilli bacterium]
MKKIIIVFFIFIFLLILLPEKEIEEETRGVFISYIEISKYLKDKNEIESKNNINKMINNIKELNLNTIILQVRPAMDAIYQSKIFPISKYLSDNNYYSYDVLDYFINESHKENIKIIAWINPYRVLTKGTINDIPNNSPTYKYIGTDILYENNGVFLNPARPESTELIINGVEEILNYDVDGIIMDDYFYPGNNVDEKEYLDSKTNLSREEYHLNTINNMVKNVHDTCSKRKVLFGISPEGNIENNYHKNYADVKKWLSTKDYVDFIIPQLYYGFENETKPFVETSNYWDEMIKDNIPLIPALAFYKTGVEDNYAKSGKNEWINNHNIIEKEIIHSRTLSHYKGFVLYRYDSIFSENVTKSSQEEIENMKKALVS